MKIAILGLGLIGGSLARALHARTPHRVVGLDTDGAVLQRALADGVIAAGAQSEADMAALLADCDALLVALYPGAAVEAVERLAAALAPGTLVVDCCGVKRPVCAALEPLAARHGFSFLGGHPMAGRERFGYDHSLETLFDGASMILTPTAATAPDALARAKALLAPLGFARFCVCTPEEHDRMIAYTSQLAHVVSSAYVQSDTSLSHVGFSAGSFQDMTRVARLYEPMWTELFLDNAEPLLQELDGLIERLTAFSTAIRQRDGAGLYDLLHAGRVRRERVTELEQQN